VTPLPLSPLATRGADAGALRAATDGAGGNDEEEGREEEAAAAEEEEGEKEKTGNGERAEGNLRMGRFIHRLVPLEARRCHKF